MVVMVVLVVMVMTAAAFFLMVVVMLVFMFVRHMKSSFSGNQSNVTFVRQRGIFCLTIAVS